VKRRYAWAELLRRVFAVDVLRCGLCGGRRELIAQIIQPGVVTAILAALGVADRGAACAPGAGAAGAVLRWPLGSGTTRDVGRGWGGSGCRA